MDEKAFWAEIYILLRNNWPAELNSLGFCDWIEPRKYSFGPHEPHVEGRVGLIGGPENEIRFILYFDGAPKDLTDVAWGSSVPNTENENWVSYDAASETLELGLT